MNTEEDALRAAWDRGYATGQEGMKGVLAEAWEDGKLAQFEAELNGWPICDNPHKEGAA